MVTLFFLSLFFSSGSVKRFTVQGKRIRTSDLLFPKQARYRAALYPGEREDDVSYRETHAGGKKSSRFFSLKRANSMWFCNPFFPTHFSRVLLLFPPPYLTISVYVINLPEAALPPHFPAQIRDSFWISFQFLFLQWYRTLVSKSVKAILGLHDSVLIWHL